LDHQARGIACSVTGELKGITPKVLADQFMFIKVLPDALKYVQEAREKLEVKPKVAFVYNPRAMTSVYAIEFTEDTAPIITNGSSLWDQRGLGRLRLIVWEEVAHIKDYYEGVAVYHPHPEVVKKPFLNAKLLTTGLLKRVRKKIHRGKLTLSEASVIFFNSMRFYADQIAWGRIAKVVDEAFRREWAIGDQRLNDYVFGELKKIPKPVKREMAYFQISESASRRAILGLNPDAAEAVEKLNSYVDEVEKEFPGIKEVYLKLSEAIGEVKFTRDHDELLEMLCGMADRVPKEFVVIARRFMPVWARVGPPC